MAPCTKCQQFNGTDENEGLCSSCFRECFPAKQKERLLLQEKRMGPVKEWEKRARAALEAADAAGLRAAFAEMEAAKASEATGDGDLCKRHSGRMQVVVEDFLDSTFKGGEAALPGLKALVDAKISGVVAPEQLLKHVIGRKNGPLPLRQFEVLVADGDVLDAVGTEHLCEALYQSPPREWVDRLLAIPHVSVTAKVIKEAKHRFGPVNGGPSKEGKALIAHLEDVMKKRAKAAADERKRERAAEAAAAGDGGKPGPVPAEEVPPPKRATRGSGPVPAEEVPPPKKAKKAAAAPEDAAGGAAAGGAGGAPEACSKICKLTGADAMFQLSAPKWEACRAFPELWTCGLHDPAHPPDHAAHVGGAWAAGRGVCEDVEKQLASWKPDYDDTPWQAFFITPETLTANGVGGGDVSVADAVCKVLGCDVLPGGIGSKMQTLALKDSRKTFFHQRFYYTFRVDTKALAKVKAATNKIKAATQKDTCVFMQFAHDHTCTVDPIVYIAGRAKPQYSDGGIFVVVYRDPNQDHYHHGSIKQTDD